MSARSWLLLVALGCGWVGCKKQKPPVRRAVSKAPAKARRARPKPPRPNTKGLTIGQKLKLSRKLLRKTRAELPHQLHVWKYKGTWLAQAPKRKLPKRERFSLFLDKDRSIRKYQKRGFYRVTEGPNNYEGYFSVHGELLYFYAEEGQWKKAQVHLLEHQPLFGSQSILRGAQAGEKEIPLAEIPGLYRHWHGQFHKDAKALVSWVRRQKMPFDWSKIELP